MTKKTLNINKGFKKLNVLLLEPNYQNKYPPIGLMKISTYHKMQGHQVTFFKGSLNSLLYETRVNLCLKALKRITKKGKLDSITPEIKSYIKLRRLSSLENVINHFPKKYSAKVEEILRHHAYTIPVDHWDRIYVTTLFTFYWKITVKTIEFAKK
ncbi:MAG: hypothetical protein MUE72_09300, partial [Chitinophagaceae bacterium]|nr:hypothetical protein [Chitinophagaceae bacterium]